MILLTTAIKWTTLLIVKVQTMMIYLPKGVSSATGSHPLGSSALRAQSMEVAVPPAANCLEPAHPDSLCGGSCHRRQEGRCALPSTGGLS